MSQQPIPGTCSIPRLRDGTWSGQLRGPLFGLAPDGVFRASSLTRRAVVSYTTFSPLPASLAKRGRFIFCGTVRRDASRRHRPRVSQSLPSCVGSQGLRGIAPYGVRTFLPHPACGTRAILHPSKTKSTIAGESNRDKRKENEWNVPRLAGGKVGKWAGKSLLTFPRQSGQGAEKLRKRNRHVHEYQEDL